MLPKMITTREQILQEIAALDDLFAEAEHTPRKRDNNQPIAAQLEKTLTDGIAFLKKIKPR